MARPNQDRLPGHDAQPSDLQWITITDPRQTVDRNTLRNLRSHVMNNYLQREYQNPNTTDIRVRHGVDKRKRSRVRPTRTTSTRSETERVELASSSGKSDVAVVSSNASTASQPAISPSSHGDDDPVERDDALKMEIATRDSVNAGRHHQEVEPQMNIEFANLKVKYVSLSKIYALLGKSFRLEPDEVTSWIDTPAIDVQVLKRCCLVNFGNKGLMKIWLPMVSQTRQTFLSSLCAAAAYLDAMECTNPVSAKSRPKDSIRTRTLFQEIIRLINKSMSDAQTRTDDRTITTVLQLLCGELMMANDAVLQLHEEGLWSMVGHRGGLDKLGFGGAIASLLVNTAFELSVFRETQPRTAYLEYADRLRASNPPQSCEKALPESPVYSPFKDLPTISNSKNCNPKTLRLIRMTRDLTSATIDDRSRILNNKFGSVCSAGPAIGPQLPSKISAPVYNAVYDIFAYPPDGNNPVYEAIRLCARLYASAIWYKIPLSVAARPPRVDDKVQHVFCGVTPALIKQALVRTELATCWDGMIGVLFWVTMVSAAACNTPFLAPSFERRQSVISIASNYQTADAAATRKWLIALAMRCSIMLCFEHPAAVAESLQRLLIVQEILSRRGYSDAIVEEM